MKFTGKKQRLQYVEDKKVRSQLANKFELNDYSQPAVQNRAVLNQEVLVGADAGS